MSVPSLSRRLVGVATIALAGALTVAPVVANAEPSPTPTSSASATRTEEPIAPDSSEATRSSSPSSGDSASEEAVQTSPTSEDESVQTSGSDEAAQTSPSSEDETSEKSPSSEDKTDDKSPSSQDETGGKSTAEETDKKTAPEETNEKSPSTEDETPESDRPSSDNAGSDTASPESNEASSPKSDAIGTRLAAHQASAADDQVETLPEIPAVDASLVALMAPPASIALTKTALRRSVSKVGQVITYRFVATNNGGVELVNVAITDELEGLSALRCDRDLAAILQPGTALICSATLTVTQDWLDFGDIDNFASVFGDVVGDDSGEEPDYVGANAAARVRVDQKPAIKLVASVVRTGTVNAGDRLRYVATATNTGNVTLTAAWITSSLAKLGLKCVPPPRATLAPGATITCSGRYRVSTADARRGRVINELMARAKPPYGDSDPSIKDVTDDLRIRVAVTKPKAEPKPKPQRTGSDTVSHARLSHAGTGSDTGTNAGLSDTDTWSDVGTETGLADTGGPSLPIGLVGLASIAAGLGLIRRSRRV